MWAIIVKEFRELVRDRRTLALIIALPLVLLTVFGYAADFEVDEIDAAVVGPGAEQLAAQLPESVIVVDDVDLDGTRDDAVRMLRDGRAHVVFVMGEDPPSALIDGSSLFTAQSAVAALGRAPVPVETEVLFNPDLETSWVMVPGLVGLIMAFIGMIVTSLGLVRERQAGTLEQLAVMPFRPSDVIVGKIAPYFAIAYVDMVIVTILGAVLFGVPFSGSIPLFGIGAALFLFVVLGIGVLISTFSENQGQAIQTAMMVALPQILLSGMIFPLESMPWGVRWIAFCLPLTYFIRISQGIMLRAAPFGALWLSFAVLALMAVIVVVAAVLRFRRDLAPDLGGGSDVGGSEAPVGGAPT